MGKDMDWNYGIMKMVRYGERDPIDTGKSTDSTNGISKETKFYPAKRGKMVNGTGCMRNLIGLGI